MKIIKIKQTIELKQKANLKGYRICFVISFQNTENKDIPLLNITKFPRPFFLDYATYGDKNSDTNSLCNS